MILNHQHQQKQHQILTLRYQFYDLLNYIHNSKSLLLGLKAFQNNKKEIESKEYCAINSNTTTSRKNGK